MEFLQDNDGHGDNDNPNDRMSVLVGAKKDEILQHMAGYIHE